MRTPNMLFDDDMMDPVDDGMADDLGDESMAVEPDEDLDDEDADDEDMGADDDDV